MKKILEVLKKYLMLSLVLSILFSIWIIFQGIKGNTLISIDLVYIMKSIVGILMITIILLPGIALIDLLLIKSACALFKDFKEENRKGRITIIVVMIILLLRKIAIWTR